MNPVLSQKAAPRTKLVFIGIRLLAVPFWGMLTLLSVILYKSAEATPWHITAIIILKPLSALFAPYWSQSIYKRPDKILSNLIWGNLLRYFPFLLTPWIHNYPWAIVAAFAIHMIIYRGMHPGWIEMVKSYLPDRSQERLIGYGSAIDYSATAALPILLGSILDRYGSAWSTLFFLTALLGFLSTLLLFLIPQLTRTSNEKKLQVRSRWNLVNPWKSSWKLFLSRPDFSRFQIGFMLGGTGLMIIQPGLPLFFVDVLNLSYTKILVAITVCKGVGFALTMPIWISFLRKKNLFYISSIVTSLASLSLFFLLGSQMDLVFLYLAYGIYGIMQAGSELSWNMSAPLFAKGEETTLFSNSNILGVGIRGSIVPLIGTLLLSFGGPSTLILLGLLLCLAATYYLLKCTNKLNPFQN